MRSHVIKYNLYVPVDEDYDMEPVRLIAIYMCTGRTLTPLCAHGLDILSDEQCGSVGFQSGQNSEQGGISLRFIHNSPAIPHAGEPFAAGIAISLESPNELLQKSVQTLSMNIALVDSESLHRDNCLQGSLTSSLQYNGGRVTDARVMFPNLKIGREGLYRLKLLLGSFSQNGMVIEACRYSEVFFCTER